MVGSMKYRLIHWLLLCLLTLPLLHGCFSGASRYHQDSAPGFEINTANIPDAVPRFEPKSKQGNPPSYKVYGRRYHVMDSSEGYVKRGVASWYGTKFHGRSTSSGETYNMYAMTAAHRSLPLPTYVRVTHLENGRSVVLRVNDRGPFHNNRLIDLSYSAAKKLGITAKGTGIVEVRAINPRNYRFQKTRRSKTSKSPKTKYKLYLQAGAFVSRNNAEQLKTRLNGLLARHEISTGFNNQNKLYRVRIGPLASIDEADQLAEKISQAGVASPYIVVD